MNWKRNIFSKIISADWESNDQSSSSEEDATGLGLLDAGPAGLFLDGAAGAATPNVTSWPQPLHLLEMASEDLPVARQ